VKRRVDTPSLPVPEPGGRAEELDPRVQRFLRFMVEMSVKSLIREQEEAMQERVREAQGRASEDPVSSEGEEK
jgi:hypothetical protein